MPELPEVETVKNELTPYIVGRKLTGVTLIWEGIVKTPSVEDFCSQLVGQKITGLARHGKYLVIGLTPVDEMVDPQRPRLNHTTGEGRLVDHHEHIEWVAVSRQSLGDHAIVARVVQR